MSQQNQSSGSTPNFLAEFLETQFNEETGDFIPAFYEQFVNSAGYLNFYRVHDVTGQFITKQIVTQAIKSLGLSFPLVPKSGWDNEVTREEFNKEYEFAKYPHVHMWIGHFAGKGKVLTWEALVEYLGVNNVERRNFDHSTINEF